MTARCLHRSRSRLSASSILLTASLGLALVSISATAQTTPSSFELRPGLVIDPASNSAFVMRPGGGVEALDLAQGAPRWTSLEVGRPLAVVGDRLVAQVERRAPGALGLAAIDIASGRSLLSRDVELPEGTIPGVVDGLGTSFVSRATAARGGVDVTWSYTRKPVGAVPDSLRPATKTVTSQGAVHFDVASGTVSERAVPTKSPSTLLLESGARLEGVDARQFRSADGRHILASESIADGRTWNRYRWTIFTAEGQRLGVLEAPVSYAPFAVVDGRLLFEAGAFARRVDGEMVEEPLRLVAAALPGGVVQWQHALRPTAYDGPFPP